MRRHDKKIHMKKANILFEERNNRAKGIIKEEFDFDSYIDSKGFESWVTNRLKDDVKHWKGKNWDDVSIKREIDNEIKRHEKYLASEQEKANKEKAIEAKIEKIKNTKTLLGKKIKEVGDVFWVRLEDDSVIYIDEYGQDTSISYDNDDTGEWKSQSASDAYGYKYAKENFEKDASSVIFQTKAEAKLFLDLCKLGTGNLPYKVKLQFIFTPDTKEYNLSLDANSFDYLKGEKLLLSRYDDEELRIRSVSVDIDGTWNDTIGVYILISFEGDSEKIYDHKLYHLSYNVQLGKLRRAMTKEVIEFTDSSLFSSNRDKPLDVNDYSGVKNLVELIKTKIKENYS